MPDWTDAPRRMYERAGLAPRTLIYSSLRRLCTDGAVLPGGLPVARRQTRRCLRVLRGRYQGRGTAPVLLERRQFGERAHPYGHVHGRRPVHARRAARQNRRQRCRWRHSRSPTRRISWLATRRRGLGMETTLGALSQRCDSFSSSRRWRRVAARLPAVRVQIAASNKPTTASSSRSTATTPCTGGKKRREIERKKKKKKEERRKKPGVFPSPAGPRPRRARARPLKLISVGVLNRDDPPSLTCCI